MPLAGVWHGDAELTQRFQRAIEHHCSCQVDAHGARSGKCEAHHAVLDQRFLDGLLFVFYLRDRLLREEQR